MNAVTFEVKQAHIRATWKAIGKFKATAILWKEDLLADMTPARFDVLQAIFVRSLPWHVRKEAEGNPPQPRWRTMEGLVKILGLASSTVSRCVKRLAELGWVEVKRVDYDRRLADVYLTAEGLAALKVAKECLGIDPREMPSVSEPNGDDARVPVDHRGMNVRTRDLLSNDRVAESQVEIQLRAHQEESGGLLSFTEVMTHHFFRLVDHFRRIARFFGSKARPLHDPRDEIVYRLHLEESPPSY